MYNDAAAGRISRDTLRRQFRKALADEYYPMVLLIMIHKVPKTPTLRVVRYAGQFHVIKDAQ